jgi:PPK2 family polyphosphate:nucleotide phosphotransferase
MKTLSIISTTPPSNMEKEVCKRELKSYQQKLFELQHKFYVDGRFGLLIILQGMDTSGKDGTIRHAMSRMNPTGINVKSFKKPTQEELEHDFLWRIYPHMPRKGMVQVFNRSYYEDILVPMVNGSLSEERLTHRATLIDQIEAHLTVNNIHILKFFLHISHEIQKAKVEKRKHNPRKKWKYEKADEITAEKWSQNMNAYEWVVHRHCNIPWHIIPADKRWYRNYSVAKVITEHFEKLDLKYPNT